MRWLAGVLLLAGPAAAVPVVPNFRSGTMTSRTESTTQVTEQIRSVNYATGYTYSASGTNVQHSGSSIVPGAGTTQTQTVDGVPSSWTGLELQDKPHWSIHTPGTSFKFVHTYSAPALGPTTTHPPHNYVAHITTTIHVT